MNNETSKEPEAQATNRSSIWYQGLSEKPVAESIAAHRALFSAMAVNITSELGAAIGQQALAKNYGVLEKLAPKTDDPLEHCLIQQFTFGHYRLLALQVKAVTFTEPAVIKIINDAICKLQRELRSLALDIRTYREPKPYKNFTVVQQQNVTSGSQSIAYQAKTDKPDQPSENISGSELGSKTAQKGDSDVNHRLRHLIEEPQAGGRRQEEPATSGAAHP